MDILAVEGLANALFGGSQVEVRRAPQLAPRNHPEGADLKGVDTHPEAEEGLLRPDQWERSRGYSRHIVPIPRTETDSGELLTLMCDTVRGLTTMKPFL